jgi:hypothetical protein
MSKVAVQKGKIVSNPSTMKQMTHAENLREKAAQDKMRKSGQTLDYRSSSKKK